MGVFDGLSRFFRRTEAVPPVMPASFQPEGLTEPDDADMTGLFVTIGVDLALVDQSDHDGRAHFCVGNDKFQAIAEDAAGSTFAIDYQDSKGTLSRRRITMRELYTNGERTYVQAFCHERRAARSFRFDRIVEVIDLDGECHDPRRFFTEALGLEFPTVATVSSPTKTPASPVRFEQPAPRNRVAGPDVRTTDKPGMAQRRAARDGLRVLVALARADGELHPEEVEVILDYIAEQSDLCGVEMTEADRAALLPYLRRQQPGWDVLGDCLSALNTAPRIRQRLLIRYAMQLMDADGVQDPAEFELVMRIQQELAAK
ncbi:WYL domain-containing protein [Azospirillum thiophilum]|nr:WYL domain-containing protein [Azospirillum thiophilum]